MWMYKSVGKPHILLCFEWCEKTENAEVSGAPGAIFILFYTYFKLLFS